MTWLKNICTSSPSASHPIRGETRIKNIYTSSLLVSHPTRDETKILSFGGQNKKKILEGVKNKFLRVYFFKKKLKNYGKF
jgi:hypothetical protein